MPPLEGHVDGRPPGSSGPSREAAVLPTCWGECVGMEYEPEAFHETEESRRNSTTTTFWRWQNTWRRPRATCRRPTGCGRKLESHSPVVGLASIPKRGPGETYTTTDSSRTWRLGARMFRWKQQRPELEPGVRPLRYATARTATKAPVTALYLRNKS